MTTWTWRTTSSTTTSSPGTARWRPTCSMTTGDCPRAPVRETGGRAGYVPVVGEVGQAGRRADLHGAHLQRKLQRSAGPRAGVRRAHRRAAHPGPGALAPGPVRPGSLGAGALLGPV